MFKYIIYFFGIELPDSLEPLAELGFFFGLISLSVLYCFLNIFGYLISITLLRYYELEKKYPKFSSFLKRFEKIPFFLLIIEGIIGFSGLLVKIGRAHV